MLCLTNYFQKAFSFSHFCLENIVVVVVVFGLNVVPIAMVIRRGDLRLKSHPKDWRSPGSNVTFPGL